MKRFITGVILGTALVAGVFGANVRYVYDPHGRLIEAHYEGRLSLLYVYDAAGNLLAKRTQTFEDSDGDGMDDAWEQSFFGSLQENGTGDADGDGFSNLGEFLAGTDPTNEESLLRVAAREDGGGVRIEWPSVAGKSYQVEYKEELGAGQWIDLAGGLVTAEGSLSGVNDPAGGSKRFYRVVLHQP